MNIYQCQHKAQQIGFDKAKFIAFFPAGPINCEWIDAYLGVLRIDANGLRNKAIFIWQLEKMFPDLVVSDPVVVK